jgi:tubby-related protein 1
LDSELYRSSVLRFINKPPDWDDNLQAYVLNFKGRVTKASVKNFLMMDEATGKTRMLFGRLAKNVFSLDIEHPFSVLQAMCVVLSSFDRKLAC